MESLNIGIETTAIGMGVVFTILIILAIITSILTKIIDGWLIPRAEAKKAAKQAPAPAPAPVAAAPVIEEVAKANGLEPKTVAAIMAAISMQSDVPLANLHFTAIRRGNTNRHGWADSGTIDIINTRQTYL